jgi:hypothetical protein
VSVTFQTAEDFYASLKSRYAHELRQLLKSGAMTQREYMDWRDDGTLDATKFPKIKELWEQMDVAWLQTKRGRAELEAAKNDSPIVVPVADSQDKANPLDEKVRDAIANLRIGKHPAADIARLVGADVISLLDSFRRVRDKLDGRKAYECLIDGQLGIEVVTDAD